MQKSMSIINYLGTNEVKYAIIFKMTSTNIFSLELKMIFSEAFRLMRQLQHVGTWKLKPGQNGQQAILTKVKTIKYGRVVLQSDYVTIQNPHDDYLKHEKQVHWHPTLSMPIFVLQNLEYKM